MRVVFGVSQWLLNAFCQQMQPEYVITVAAGCKLQPKCARQLLHRFERQASAVLVLPDAHIASPMLFNPVTMSQLFMSKYCAALAVPFSSAFGYVSHTSPTCAVVGLSHCAALRWKALPVSALGKFFEGQERAIVTLGPMAANRYAPSPSHCLSGHCSNHRICPSCLDDNMQADDAP